MENDKILKIIVGIVIIGYIIISSIPYIMDSYKDTKDKIDGIKQNYYVTIVDNYIKSKPDYYYNYEGATYCISVRELINNGILTESQMGDNADSIIEATYKNNQYMYIFNNECVEK